MRPISIRFRCFGPYMEEQCIDFTQFEENGLFLICGETGAGKTTILDAMCYALYGRSSGGLRGDLEVMRCKLADKQDETLVEYIFEVNHERYCFTRSLKYGRKNLNDHHNCMILRDGVYVPVFENPKATLVNQKAQELIGLSYDQFRQVVMLPQGQFEKLLVSDSVEKEKILVKLFHADRWQTVAEEIGRRVNARDNALKLQWQQIMAQLNTYGCDSLEAMDRRITADTEALDACEEALLAAQQTYDRQKAQYDAALLDNQLFIQLRQARSVLQGLENRRAAYDREAALLEAAAAAQSIYPEYAACQTAKTALEKASAQVNAASEAHAAAMQSLDRAKAAVTAHENGRGEYERSKERLVLLKNARQVYLVLDGKQAAVKRADKAWQDGQARENASAGAFSQADACLQSAVLAQRTAMENYWQVQNGYFQSIGVTLAKELVAGQPCPVCGSREHPTPVQPTGTVVSQGEVEQAKTQMEKANTAVSEAMQKREQAESAHKRAVSDTQRLAQERALAEAEYAHLLGSRIPGIENEEQLSHSIKTLRSKTAGFEKKQVQLSDAFQTANNALQMAAATEEACRDNSAQAQQTYARAQQNWQQSLKDCAMTEQEFTQGYMEPRLLQKRSAELNRYRADLAAAERTLTQRSEAVEGHHEPDMAAAQSALESAQANLQALHTRRALAKKALDTMRGVRDTLAVSLKDYHTERAKVDADLEFSSRLRGTNGLSLQRYVLGVMLTSITVAANRLLKDVYGGRYQLFRTNEIAGSGRKSGLELEVYDAAHAQRRSVTTLSGGEKFLVALSLALGLSTVVQAQGGGIRLDAMFVDEGFGSLDTEAVNDALEVLQSIRRSSGIVGIISHVDQLAETIPAKIRVRKGKDGSTCHVIC